MRVSRQLFFFSAYPCRKGGDGVTAGNAKCQHKLWQGNANGTETLRATGFSSFLPARAAAFSQVKQSSRPFDWPLQLFRSPPIRPLLTTAETNSEARLTCEGLETEVQGAAEKKFHAASWKKKKSAVGERREETSRV